MEDCLKLEKYIYGNKITFPVLLGHYARVVDSILHISVILLSSDDKNIYVNTIEICCDDYVFFNVIVEIVKSYF